MQGFRKTNEQTLRYLKTDGHTDRQGRLLRTTLGEQGIQNQFKHLEFSHEKLTFTFPAPTPFKEIPPFVSAPPF